MDSLVIKTSALLKQCPDERYNIKKQIESTSTTRTNENIGKKSLVDMVAAGKKLIWNHKQEDTNLERFKELIRRKYDVKIESYWDLHAWSVTNKGKFWEELLKFSNIIYSEPHYQVVPAHGKLSGVDWFKGMRFNYAENFLKYRDDHIAIICLDEEGREYKCTYAKLYEEVKLYAAAFRKHGLKSGDKVSCYVSNREEAVFAMLACASIGALWGGPLPSYGAKAATKILLAMQPKFLFTVDRYSDNHIEERVMDRLPAIVNQVSSLEKVIIVTTKEETLKKDISGIKNSCFLEDFLNSGRNPDGTVPELVFEQVPFDHPLTVNFTSGTTGAPKGLVHSQGVLLAMMRDLGLHHNFSREDVAFTDIASGWIAWNANVSVLAFGATLVLQVGCAFFYPDSNTWDTVDKYKVTWTVILTSSADQMEKINMVPRPNCKLEKLRVLLCAGTPMKMCNYDFFRKCLRRDDIVLGALYGSTEVMSMITGFDTNEPIYTGEIQVPALGIDLRVLDDAGNLVIGQRGEVSICCQLPHLPLYLLNDPKGERLQSEYLSKFPGVWSMNDEGWIDPETRGLVIIGRSDDVFKPYDERYGSADIYFAIQDMKDITDSLCVRQNNEKGFHRAVLFVKMAPGITFNEQFVEKIKRKIECELTDDFIPQVILETKDIPYSLTGKKLEKLVTKIINSNEMPEVNNVRNPECLKSFLNIPELQNY